MRRWLTALVVLLVPTLAEAGTYWVSPTGAAASWAACQSATPLSGTAACTLAQANANASAGDTVYLREGTYTLATYGCGVCTTNSGTAGNWITFSAYGSEVPTITQPTGGYTLELSNKRYIKVVGLRFYNTFRGDITNGSDHIEIDRCTFVNAVGVGRYFLAFYEGGGSPVTHTWIHDSTFLNAGDDVGGCAETGFHIVYGTAPDSGGNDYHTLDNNVLSHSGHGQIETFGRYLVLRNNVLRNEPWRAGGPGCTFPNAASDYDNDAYAGLYGHRDGQTYGDNFSSYITWNLLEGNRFGYAGANPGNDGADGWALTAAKNIIRYNAFYGNMNNGLLLKNGGDSSGNDNRIFNNTFYHNGYGYSGVYAPAFPYGYESNTGIAIYNTVANTNVIKNNLLYDNYDYAKTYRDIQVRFGQDPTTNATVVNNWITTNGDPLFVNTSLSDVTSTTLPDLRLRAGSGAINGGVALTTATSTQTSSTSLVVVDAQYFQDGTWGADMARGVTYFPDWVAVGTVGNVAQISSVNYTTNTITLASPLTWTNGASVWLYKDSSGSVVLYGSAPDYGAHEYVTSAVPNAPTNVRIR